MKKEKALYIYMYMYIIVSIKSKPLHMPSTNKLSMQPCLDNLYLSSCLHAQQAVIRTCCK